MNTAEFFNELLGLTDGWVVSDIHCVEDDIVIDVECRARRFEIDGEAYSSIYDFAPVRMWRHLDTLQYKTFIRCRLPRVKTKQGNVKTIDPPWSRSHQRHTCLFECWAIQTLSMTRNQTKTAEFLRVGFNVVNSIIHSSVQRGLKRRDAEHRQYRRVSIDEKSFRRGHSYISVLSDPDTGNIIDAAEGRSAQSCENLIENGLPGDTKRAVERICVDMWRPYISTSQTMMPHAALTHDRFHLVKHLNAAIDAVRRREMKTNGEELKHSRYALLKNKENRTEKQQEIFDAIRAGNYRVGKAWEVKENFRSLFRTPPQYAPSLFEMWAKDSAATGIKEINKVVDMFRTHAKGVISSLSNTLTNAMAERLNGKIQQLKGIARGYRTFANFRSAILFFYGGLDLYPSLNSG